MIRIALLVFVAAAIAGILIVRHNNATIDLMPPTDDLATWHCSRLGGVSGKISIEQGVLRVDTLAVDGHPGDLGISHHGVVLEPGCRYRLAFTAKADSSRKIPVDANTAGYGGKWEPVGLNTTFDIGKEWTSHETAFTPFEAGIGHKIDLPVFQLGDKVGTVWIKDVVVEKIR